MRTYYLFIDSESFDIHNVFDALQETRIIEPGIEYKEIKYNYVLPQYIVIESIYKDEYFKSCLTTLLRDMGYDKHFQLVKPLVKEMADVF